MKFFGFNVPNVFRMVFGKTFQPTKLTDSICLQYKLMEADLSANIMKFALTQPCHMRGQETEQFENKTLVSLTVRLP